MKKVLITGSEGNIGRILKKGLSDYDLSFADLPETDLRDNNQSLKSSKDKDVIIHLAWNCQTENFQNEKIDTDNSLMFYNIYRAALENKVPRVIMASSVHAQDWENYHGKTLLTPEDILPPTSPYGADKIFMESLGKYYSKKVLEVICVRFGAVDENCPKDIGKYIWLSGDDCANLMKSLINAKSIPNNFSIVNGFSTNKGGFHSLKNPFGWKPVDGYKGD